MPGVSYNSAVVIDADGTNLGTYPEEPPAARGELLGEVLLSPGNLGWPVFDTAVGRIGVSICYDQQCVVAFVQLRIAEAWERVDQARIRRLV